MKSYIMSDIAVTMLVKMLKYAFDQKMLLVSNLSSQFLNVVPLNYNNNIGALLKHLCYMERYVQMVSFEGSGFDDEEKAYWKGTFGIDMIPGYEWGHSIEYYIYLSTYFRERSIQQILTKSDEWLYTRTMANLKPSKTQLQLWTHLLEEEFGHSYQIRMILKHI